MKEFGEDTLIPFLERVLETDQEDEWSPLEPEVRVEVRPVRAAGYADYASGHTDVV